jgi:hypothetical protein
VHVARVRPGLKRQAGSNCGSLQAIPSGGLQPGQYSVRLTVDGQSYSQPVTIKPDPRAAPKGAVDEAGGE